MLRRNSWRHLFLFPFGWAPKIKSQNWLGPKKQKQAGPQEKQISRKQNTKNWLGPRNKKSKNLLVPKYKKNSLGPENKQNSLGPKTKTDLQEAKHQKLAGRQ